MVITEPKISSENATAIEINDVVRKLQDRFPIKIAFYILAISLIASRPAFASTGCGAFYGTADDQTKGEGGSRTGTGFSKGDTLKVTISEDPGQMKTTANLLQYASPDGPFRALVKDTPDSFTYTVPENTSDTIYLNFGGPFRGMIVKWNCVPAVKP